MAESTGLPRASFDEIIGAKDIDERVVDVPAWERSVVIRGLSRGQVRQLGEFTDTAEAEAHVLMTGLVDPKVTKEQAIKILADKSHGATEMVMQEIMLASNLEPGAVRAAQNSFLE
jgi:hypothetical protein